MTGITEVKAASAEICQTNEHRDEHALFVAFNQGSIHTGGYLGGLHLLGRKRTEEAGGLGHEERGRNTLATDVANAEIEMVALHQVTVEVAAHLPGRRHRSMEVNAFPLREDTGYHRHLYVPGNTQFTLDTFLDGSSLLQLVVGPLQLGMGYSQFVGGLPFVEGID